MSLVSMPESWVPILILGELLDLLGGERRRGSLEADAKRALGQVDVVLARSPPAERKRSRGLPLQVGRNPLASLKRM